MIWGVVFIGFIIRLINLNQSLWLDEAINIMASHDNSLWQMISQYALADFHPPGWFIILWVINHIFGYSEIVSRFPSLIFGTISIYLIYIVAKKIFNDRVGILSAVFLSINGLHIFYSQEARMYSFATCAVLLNIYFFLKLIKKENYSQFLYAISAVLVLSSDYLSYLIFFPQFIYLFFYERQAIKRWVISLIPGAMVFLIWLPFFYQQLNIGLQTAVNLSTWNAVVGGFSLKQPGLTFIKFIIGRISFDDKTLYYGAMILICSFFSSLILFGIKKKLRQSTLVLMWLIIPFVLAWVISLLLSILSYFRVLYLLPAFLILIALGINEIISSRLKNITLSFVIIIFSVSSTIYLMNSSQQREDWKSLIADLDKKDGVVLMESNGLFSPFAYYAQNRDIKAQGGLKILPAKNSDDVIEISELNTKKIYQLEYLVDIFDPNRLLSQKIENAGFHLERTFNYHGVGLVYLYSQ